ncbi:ABC transporter ATP-binding protein [Nonomuraea sp. NPDC046570]|uniref:ABC transporter ATP-binding protein n=1 Tax=Nonomuraea sp. NPDC046570 TaxID=3155255 RepID=UPI00340292B3
MRLPPDSGTGRGAALGGVVPALRLAWRAAPGTVTLLVLTTVVSSVVPVGIAWLTKLVLDRVAAADGEVFALAGGLALLGLTLATLPEVLHYLQGELNRATGLLAQDRLFTAVNRLPGLARFEDPVFLDRLRLANQSGGMTPSQVVQGALALGGGLLTAGGLLGSLTAISPVIAGVVLLGTVPALVAQTMLSRRRAAMLWKLGPVQRRELFYSQLLSDLKAVKEVRLFGLAGFLQGRMLTELRRADAERRTMDRRELRVQAALGALSAAIAGAGLIWVIVAAGSGGVSVGDVSMFVAAVAGVQGSLAAMVGHIASAHQQLLLFQHFRDVEAVEPDLVVPARSISPEPLRKGIEFRDVWFRYGPEHPWVLRGVSFTVPFGRTVGLVGRNGSGKSTLVKLLCRFYDPERGGITWDGVDLREIDPAELRDRMSAVFQDFMVYDLSAAENIGLGNLASLDDRGAVEEAARRAGVHEELAELPYGYDTLLTRVFFQSEDAEDPSAGVALSGGRSQRVAVARGVFRGGRDLLILDEPSSGLDAEAEHEVHARLREHRRGATSLLISHRLGAVREADTLVVLDGGRIVEQGSHEELAGTGGVYARLFSLQASGYRDSE